MEKVFENLKEEFNRKISTDSFISYFVKHNDVNGGGSSSDSFEDITSEVSYQPDSESSRHSHEKESFVIDSLDLSKVGDNVNLKQCYLNKQLQQSQDNAVLAFSNEEIKKTDNENIKDHLGYLGNKHCPIENDTGIICNHSTDVLNEDSFNKLLNVINEEDGNEHNKISVIEFDVKTVGNLNKSEFLSNNYKELFTESKRPSIIKKSKSLETKKSKKNDDNEVKIRNHGDLSLEKNVKKQSMNKMMWSEMPEVLDSGLLNDLPKKEIQLQEAMFEIIASEASYYQSLMILTSHFFESDLFSDTKDHLVSPLDKHHIFSNVILIMSTSQNFLNDLDKRWRDEKPLLKQICDVIFKHASSDDFQNYVTYLRNQEYQRKALKRLTENETFRHQLHKLETSSVCGKLSIDSYLMLPMQRLTRLKLLLDALLKLMYCEELREKVSEKEIDIAETTLERLKQLLDTSDFEKGFMDQKSMLMLLMNKMDFPPNFKIITISDKIFIKEGELRVHQQNTLKLVRKFSKKRQPTVSLILFNDLLIIAKKKRSRLMVIDYCDRSDIKVSETKFKSIVSSTDFPNNTSSVDLDDRSDDPPKISVTSLARSRTSMSAEDWKRINSSLSNSIRSLSLTNRNDEHELIFNSFSIQFIKSQTDIFSIPLVLLAKNKAVRDEWIDLLGNSNSNDIRLHKTTSLRNNVNRKEDFRLSKHLPMYVQGTDEP